ncbi:regulator of volume decrease after cellular swelling-domain-containing protein [Irpex rosettiformis]|uniref:Regulator of volume decrease after cellular swelling-domain-containing protein n=1 Tax=Irpex rosettiformis TaxID=378272 RepID=A0ACB8U790_9APHY|nr:regulator of volume decrease after cellular swelling-domain-containing protein [Irpex rosettiformis]
MAPILIIDEIPKFISPEEHRTLIASTPASFSDIPPVLRHQEEDVSITLDPPLEGFSTEECSKGTLYVIESVLVYKAASGRGIQIEYPSITLHAISRAESGPSIYCQLDESAATPDANGDEGETTEMRELTIIPKEVAALELIFEALSVCAALHPDPADADDMDDDDDDAFIDADENSPFETFTGAEGEELSEVGRVRSNFVNDNRFAPY